MPKLKEQKKEETKKREENRRRKSPRDQLAKLDQLFGKGRGAKKERIRLQKKMLHKPIKKEY